MSLSKISSSDHYDLTDKSKVFIRNNLSFVGDVGSNPGIDLSQCSFDNNLWIANGNIGQAGDFSLNVGRNSSGAGFRVIVNNTGESADVRVNGTVTASNVPTLGTVANGSGGVWEASDTIITVANHDCLTTSHVHVTGKVGTSDASVLSHIVPTDGQFQIHLDGANSTQDLEFFYALYNP